MREKILEALSHVEDPDLKKDLVSLNMIRNLEISDSSVRFDLFLTTPACPMKDMLKNACITAIKTMVDQNLDVEVRVDAEVSSSRLNAEVLKGVKNIIAVASGKGGVGKSTVAVNLAKALSKEGVSVGILDADIHGPSIPTLMGIADVQPEMEGSTILPVDVEGIKTISIGLMVPKAQAIVWRGPMLSNAFNQLSSDVKWGDLDYLIIDLPPGTGDVHLSLVQHIPLTGVLIVTSPEEVSVADARKAISMFKIPQINKPLLGIVENMSYFQPAGQAERYSIFGSGGGKQLADEFGMDLLAEIPVAEFGKRDMLDLHYSQLAGAVVRRVSILNASK